MTGLIAREGTFTLFVWNIYINGLAESFLKTLFIVSDISVIDEGSLGTSSPSWLYTGSVQLPGEAAVPLP